MFLGRHVDGTSRTIILTSAATHTLFWIADDGGPHAAVEAAVGLSYSISSQPSVSLSSRSNRFDECPSVVQLRGAGSMRKSGLKENKTPGLRRVVRCSSLSGWPNICSARSDTCPR